MNGIKSNYAILKPPAQRAVWITLLLGIALSTFAILLLEETIDPLTTLQVRIANSIPLVLGLVAFASTGLFLGGKPEIGTWTLFLSTILSLILAPMLAEGYGFAASAIVLIVTLFLPAQILKSRESKVSIVLGIAAAISVIIIDEFWPDSISRIEADYVDINTANILTGILLFIILVQLIFQFRKLSLRSKLVVVFLGLTIFNVGIVSMQSIVMNSRSLRANIGEQVNQVAKSNAFALGNEFNRLVNVLTSISFSSSLQNRINESNKSYPTDPVQIHKIIQDLGLEWRLNFDTQRDSVLIYDRLTNNATVELRGLTDRVSNLGSLFVTDRYGGLVGTVVPIREYDFSKATWWEAVYNNGAGDIYIGQPEFDDDLNRTIIMVAVPVLDKSGNDFIGSIATKYPIDGFVERFYTEAKLLGRKAGINLILSTNPPTILEDSEARACQSNEKKPIGFLVGNDAIMVVVSRENSFVKTLSIDQLKSMFTTAITWDEINPDWPREPILRYLPTIDTETLRFFHNKVIGPGLNAKVTTEYSGQVMDEKYVVERVLENPYAIGYVSAPYYNQNSDQLNLLSIDGVAPSQETLESGAYPMTRPLVLYTSTSVLQEQPQVVGFINYFLSHANEEAVKAGYFPLSQENILISRINLASATGIEELYQVNPNNYDGSIIVTSSSSAGKFSKIISNRFMAEGFSGDVIINNTEPDNSLEQFCTTSEVDLAAMNQFIDENPHLLVRENMEELLQQADIYPYFEQTINLQDSLVSFASVIDQQTSEYIAKLGWKVLVYNSIEDALQPVQTQERVSIAILLVVGTIASVGALGLAQFLAGPIQRLGEAARKFGAGDLKTRATVETQDEIGNLAITFNNMADRIHHILGGLEQQVDERTRAVVTSAEISRRLSRILDQRQLVLSVVEEIQRSFSFYHSQIYLFDDEQKTLVLVGGSGEIGKVLVERGHKIEPGRGLVGRSALSNSTIMVADTHNDPNWLANPLLPETKSEAAIPIAIGDQVLGVLDVQQNIPGGINPQTVDLLKSISNQVAIAVQNARLYKKAQNQAAKEASILDINQKIQSSKTLPEVLRTVTNELGMAISLMKGNIIVETILFEGNHGRQGFGYSNHKVYPIESDTRVLSKDTTLSEEIKIQDEKIGSLVVSGLKSVDEDTQDLVTRVAIQMGQRIENMRLSEQTRQAFKETDALYNIIAELNSAKEFDNVLAILAERTILSNVDRALIMFFFDKPLSKISIPEWVIPISALHTSNKKLAKKYPLSAFEVKPNTLFTNTTVVIENIKTDTRLDRLTSTLFQDVFAAESSIIIPLLTGEQSMGFIMGNFSNPRHFNDSDIQRLSTVANQVAITVQGMQLMNLTVQRARRERLLREVANQVNNAVGTDAILRRAAEHIGKALNHPVFVHLGKEDRSDSEKS